MQTIATPHAYSETRWLKCLIDKGMFSDELVVTYPMQGDKQKSVFVPDVDAQGHPGEMGSVRVVLCHQGDALFAVLPSAERDIVAVREADVVA